MKSVVQHAPPAGKAEAEEGIIAPLPEVLLEGSYIYRFASHSATFGCHAGCWWISEADFQNILDRATRTGVDLGQKARWDLVILSKWGNSLDVVIQARISSRLWAWTGLAKPQIEEGANGKIIRIFGHRGIKHLYLHDVIDDSGMLTSRGREALSITGAQIIASTPLR
jgi:hypothetical protein